MNTKENIANLLVGMNQPKLLSIVTLLMFELTIAARECYNDWEKATDRLRAINETVHRLSGVMLDLQNGDASSVSPVVAAAFCSDRDDAKLRGLFKSSLERALSKLV